MTLLRDLLQDLRYGARTLRRSPGFTVMVMLTLALGISANVAIFTLIEAVFLRPLPVRAPDELVFFSESDDRRGSGPLHAFRLPVVSYPLYQRLVADGATVWSGLAAQQSGHTLSVVRRAGVADVDKDALADAAGRAVTANYFDVFGVCAFRGRTFATDDQTASGANPVVVLSHRFWQRRFDSDPSLLGARLSINGTQYTVIGIAPPVFVGSTVGSATDFWVPITMEAKLAPPKSEGRNWQTRLEQPAQWWLGVVGRLRPGVPLATAQASVSVTFQQFLAQQPDLVVEGVKPQAVQIGLEPGSRGVATMRQMVLTPLTMLMAGVGLLLVIVCLDVSHLLLARANRRQREMSIRTALGATRARLVRQLLCEGLLLATLAAALALVIAPWLVQGLLTFTDDSPADALVLDVSLDARLLGFTGGLGLATAVLLGLVPAWQATRSNLAQALRATAAAVTSRSRRLASRLLLASQVAFSLVLLVAAGLLTSSLASLRSADKGFDEQHVLLARLNPRIAGLDEARARELPDTLMARIGAIPGVSNVSLSTYGLFSGRHWNRSVSHARNTPSARQVTMNTNGVTAGYFDTVGTRLLRGRGFPGDERGNTRALVVLNESAARKLFGDQDPLGKHLHEHGRVPKDMEVVGVVRDAKTHGLTQPSPPMYYVPISQQDDFAESLEVRAAGDPALLADQVLRAMREISPGLAVLSVRSMKAQVERALGGERILATLSTAFGLTALFLVSLGLYGVISQWVVQRTQEIGVRMALGATAAGVRWMVLRSAFVLVLAGVAIGLPAAVAASTLMKGALFGVQPMDPKTLIAAAASMFVVAALAAYLPARRASRVQPMVALRSE